MNKNLFKQSLLGFIFVSIIGSLSHFVFKWSGYSIIAALFCPVNESIWEHLKLIFFPYLIWAIAQSYLMKSIKKILMSKCIAAVAGMLTIVTFYYTYTGIFGKSIEFLNILSFFIGVAVAFAIDYVLINQNKLSSNLCTTIAAAAFIIIGILFITFTFMPPLIPLFKDPIYSTYGI